jgi:3-deoxy-manno-octulosonate cytidylyltransferase (CMP-KDO synthetase)
VRVVACIPARYSSTRFPGKVLAKDTGKFLIQHTYERARLARLPERVIIAADDEKVVAAAYSFGAACVLTAIEHQSGTDRIAEAVEQMDADIVVNIQADEPEIEPANIDYVARLLIENPDYPMATLAADFDRAEQIADPNIVKVIVAWSVPRTNLPADGEVVSPEGESLTAWASRSSNRGDWCGGANGKKIDAKRYPPNANCGRAIYFSRAPIPYDRDAKGIGQVGQYKRHLGIYAYRKDFLLRITALPQTPLEKIEKLEQLRAIENGFGILVGKVKHTCDGIDTPEQYAEFVHRHNKSRSRAEQ